MVWKMEATAGQRMKKVRKVLVVDSSCKEEKESGCYSVIRMLEAREEGKMEWRLQQVEGGYDLLKSQVKMIMSRMFPLLCAT